MSRYNTSRTKYLLSTLPAHYQDEPDAPVSPSTSYFEPKTRSTIIRPSRSKFISQQLHTQVSHLSASLLQSRLLAIYYPAWSQFNNGMDLHSQLNGLKSNINARNVMTADLRKIWLEDELEIRNRKFIIKDLGEHDYSCFVRESRKTFVFISNRFESAYKRLFKEFEKAKGVKEKDFILFQIEQIDIVVLCAVMKEDINDLEFRGERISPLLKCHTLSDNAERQVFGGLVRLLQSQEEYTVVCISTVSQTRVTSEGAAEISDFLEFGATFPVFPFFKSNRAKRFDPFF